MRGNFYIRGIEMKRTRILLPYLLFISLFLWINPAFSFNGAFHPDSLKINNKIFPLRENTAQKTSQNFGNQLTQTGISKSDTDWSPDGKLIAFSQDGAIYTVSPLGGIPKNLTLFDTGYCFEPSFSADGQGIFYSRWDYTLLTYTVQYIDINGLNGSVIVNNALLGVQSPDAKYFIYKRFPESDLVLYSADAGTSRIIAPADSLYGSSCFSPDNKFVITSMKSADGTKKLFQIPVLQVAAPKRITISDGNHDYPDFSPDGKWIMYTELDIGDIWALNILTGEEKQVFAGAENINFNAHFSANGLRFEYLLDTSGVYEIWIADFPFAQTVVKSLNITSPSGGETFTAGSVQQITWTSANIATVSISYSTDSGSSWTLIASGLNASSGAFSWTVPNTPSTNCLIRIFDNSNNDLQSTSPGNFTISAIPVKYIKVTSPNGGEVFQAGTTRTITWESEGVEEVKIEISSDGGINWSLIGSSMASAKSFSYNVPSDLDSDQCLVRITQRALENQATDKSDSYFTIATINTSIIVQGTINYQGKPISQITKVSPDCYVFDIITGETFDSSIVKYDSSTGKYSIENPPTDFLGVTFFFHIKQAGVSFPGDYVGYIETDLILSTDYNYDVELYKVLHMNLPYDNNFANLSMDTKPKLNSPLLFEWESLPGASTYEIYITRNRDVNHPDGEGFIEDVISEIDYTGTSYSASLPQSLANEYYSFALYALDADFNMIGLYVASFSQTEYNTSTLDFTIIYDSTKSIEVVSPNGDENIIGGSVYDITWKMNGIESVNIKFSKDSGVSWTNIVSNYVPSSALSTTQYKYSWTIPDISAQSSLIKIEDASNTSVFDQSNYIFTITKAVTPVTVKWKYGTSDKIAFSSPAIGNEVTTYIGSNDGYLYAIDSTGSLKWYYNLGNAVWSSPAISISGTIYVGSFDYNLYAIDPDGTLKWQYATENGILSTPAIASDSTIVFGSSDAYLYKLYPNGKLKWKRLLNGTIYSSPAIGVDGAIYVGDNTGLMYAFDVNGNEKWRYQTGGSIFSSPAIDGDGTIYIGSSNGSIYALNPNGTLKWNNSLGAIIESSPVIGSEGKIYIGTEGNGGSIKPGIFALNRDGSVFWNFDTGGDIISSPAIGADGTIYVGSSDSTFYAVNPDGRLKWEYPVGSMVWSSPSISKTGIVIFGAYDGYVYALDTGTNAGLAASTWPKFHTTQGNTGRIIGLAADFVRVNAPNGGENIVPGSSFAVTWNSNGVSNVIIEFSKDNGQNWTVIADNIPASNHTYNWTVPQGISSAQCFIRITSKENSAINDLSNGTFTISQAAFVKVTYPNGGEILNTGATASITWQYYGVSEVEIQFTKNDGAAWSTIGNVSAANGTFSWTVPGEVSNLCRIKVIDKSNSAVNDESDGNFSISSGKFVNVKTPSLGEKWSSGSVKEIKWEFNGVSNVKIEFSTDNGQTWIKIIDSVSSASGLYSWTVPQVSSTQCLIKITDILDASIFDICDKFEITEPELKIVHTQITEAKENEKITFYASITSTSEIKEVFVYYDVTGKRTFQNKILMTLKEGNTYSASLSEGLFTGMGMEYFISATDKDDRKSRSPADVGYYSIKANVSDLRSSQKIAGGSEQNSYRMMSIPLNLKSLSITEQLMGRLPSGGSGTDWRLFRYPEGITTPNEYPNIEGFSPGKAYWIISKSEFQFMAPEGTTVTTADPFTITLKAGWNDIANPWIFNISWDDIENPSGADLSKLYTYEGKWSDPSAASNILEPWKGYSVNNLSNMNVVIRLKPRPANSSAAKPLELPEQIKWMVSINASAGLARDTANHFGVRNDASPEWDKFDHIEPVPVGEYVSVSFPHNDWSRYPHEYTVDFRPQTENETSWDFLVKTNIKNEKVSVSFDGIESLSDGIKYKIVDLDSGKRMELNNNNSFTFVSGKTLTERHFRFTTGPNLSENDKLTIKPGTYITAQCYPNPFNPSTTIRYELYKAGNVSIAIYNSVGQRVAISDFGRKEPGAYDYVFDASELTSGLYFYRIECGQASITGKMIFMK